MIASDLERAARRLQRTQETPSPEGLEELTMTAPVAMYQPLQHARVLVADDDRELRRSLAQQCLP